MNETMPTSSPSEGYEQHLLQALPKLTPEEVAKVSPRLKRQRFGSGAVVISQGDDPDRFYIVIDGEAEVVHEGLSGRTATVDVCRPGDYFGEAGLLQNRPRNSTVRVPEGGFLEVLAMERDDFLAMLRESKATEMHVAQEMLQRLIELASAQ
ncbi:MAG: cyclic nucleotide-binding domain-containing protein [Candidatus Promineifilaceae bacterium]|nr:cyclic nucleotide-binding domain-containing protein [Candidatus Promineifilaceae bacterium]